MNISLINGQSLLQGHNVNPILRKEAQALSKLINPRGDACCCIPIPTVEKSAHDQFPISHKVCCLRYSVQTFIMSGCVGIGFVIFFCYKTPSEGFEWILKALLIASVASYVILELFRAIPSPDSENWFGSPIIYDLARVRNIKSKIKDILENLKSDEGYYCPEEIAFLNSKDILSSNAINCLIKLMSVHEFQTLVNLTTLHSLTNSANSLKRLIITPPPDALKYSELVLRASELLRTDADYECLREMLPPNDNRRYVLIMPVAKESESSDQIAIDIIETTSPTIVVSVDETEIYIDAEKLDKQSEWFHVFFEGKFKEKAIFKINIETNTPFKEQLIKLLRCLNGTFSSLWTPIDPMKKDQYLELLEAMEYYQFNLAKMQFCEVLLDAQIFKRNEKMSIIKRLLLSPGVDLAIKNKCSAWVFNQILKEESLEEWLDFAVQHFSQTLVPYLNGCLAVANSNLSPQLIMCLIKLKEHFPHVMPQIRSTVEATIKNSVKLYAHNQTFLAWYAEQMPITLDNFCWQWECKTLRDHKAMNHALEQFGRRNKVQLLQLWPMGWVPLDLLELWNGDQ